MSLSTEQRLEIIHACEMPPPEPQFSVAGNSAESASVADGSSISFVSNVQGQMKSDILNSTLFAQLASSKKYDRQDKTKEWYENYKYVLETVGWNVSTFDLAALTDANKYFTVDNLLIKLAQQYLSAAELSLFTTMIESLKETKNNSAVRIFDSSAKKFNKANFQVGVASNAGGNAMFKIGVYSYSASQNIDKVLFFTFGSQSVSFLAGNQVMVLNEDVYRTVRDSILKKLGQNAKDKVEDIEI